MGTKENALREQGAYTTNYDINFTGLSFIKQETKRLVVGLACRGILPVKLAGWIIRGGGLRHE